MAAVAAAGFLFAGVGGAQTADVVFVHGDILTGTRLRAGDRDPVPGRVHALAVRGGRVVLAGEDAAVLALRGPQTVVVDLHGAFAMPGFNDAHTHMAMAGQQRLAVNLVGAASLAEMQARIRAYLAGGTAVGAGAPAVAEDGAPTRAAGDVARGAANGASNDEQGGAAPMGGWLLGGGWDHTLWPSKTLPSRKDLDAVTGDRPALFDRVDGHIAVANTAALKAAGISAATPDPAGGRIDRGPDGEPTGILREAPALALVQKVIPRPDYEVRKRALQLSIDDALAHGVTSVQDFSDWDDWLVLEEWEHTGKLPMRFAEWIAFDLPLPILEERRASHPVDDPLLHLTQLKAFMDGSLGSRTAALEEPYSDEPGNSGLPRYDQTKLNQMTSERAAAGFQLGFHAIGDRANDMALDAFEAADQVGVPAVAEGSCAPARALLEQPDKTACVVTPRELRFRIEHAQVVSPGAFARFAQLGVIASMQPSHLLTDMAWAGQRLGPERSARSYAWRSFLDHGVTLAFGTDYPVESISPFRGLYAAVTRQNEAGTQSFFPGQKLTLNEALYAYTQASAFAEFREHVKGRLEPGYVADLVVLDRDITAVTPRELLGTRVLRTVVGGETRFEASPQTH